MENYKDGDRIRIWLEDSMETEGGTWCYGKIEEIKIIKKIFVQDGFKLDPENEIEDFKGYKIEKLN
ncbi:MAG: hypothetical protein RIR01_579 [Bacteroidota bacterium]